MIYTPDNEPYLGRAPLMALDKSISAALALNKHVAPATHSGNPSELQSALCQLIPAGLSISLSIRELLRQGYVYGALVLLRPLAERTVTALYLRQFPDALALWHSGWEHGKRPGFSKMIRELWGDEFPSVERTITRSLNSLVHGDPESAKWNLIVGEGNFPAYAVSKIIDRPDLCDQAALETATYLAELMGLMTEAFLVPETGHNKSM